MFYPDSLSETLLRSGIATFVTLAAAIVKKKEIHKNVL